MKTRKHSIALVMAASVLSLGAAYGQTVLTDISLWGAGPSGSYIYGYPNIWETRPGNNFNIWIQSSAGQFLNGPTDAAARPNISLATGVTSFRLLAAPGVDVSSFGINLFFNGSSTPSVSAFGPMLTSNGPHSFSANSAASTAGVFGSHGDSVPGAGTLSVIFGDKMITLTDFYWATPSVYALDLVGGPSIGPDGEGDYVGGITLSVTTIPEPGCSFFLVTSLALGAAVYRRRPCSAPKAV